MPIRTSYSGADAGLPAVASPSMSAQAFTAMAELAASRHGTVLRHQAVSLGISPRDITTAKRQGWLTEPVRGVLVFAGQPSTFEQRLAVVTSASTSGPVASHRAAARLLALDGFEHAGPEVSTMRPGRVARSLTDTVICHQVDRLDRSDVIEIAGVRCTSVARTLADLGHVCDRAAVWKALIAARRVHRVHPGWLHRTATRLHRPGQAGTGSLLWALRRWSAEGALPESWLEELVRRLAAHPGIPAVVAQHEIRDGRGRFVARLDFAIPSLRLGIEAHSRQFHYGPIREAADEDRDLRAAACGWELLYIGWYATRQPAEVAQLIAEVCRRRGEQQRSA